MLATLDDLVRVVHEVYTATEPPKPLQILRAVQRSRAGESPDDLARALRLTPKRLAEAVGAADPIADVLKCTLASAADEAQMRRARRMLGQLLVGRLAERAFEAIYRETMGTTELRLEDQREAASETDYRVFNGQGRPVFRLNIKFHGTLFQKALDLVGLRPEDCFALATYKIDQAVRKQDEEHLPYIFAIVSVPGLTGEVAGVAVPEDLVHLVALVHGSKMAGKRAVEDEVVSYMVATARPDVRDVVARFAAQIANAEWRVLSARKADRLLREKLFERVYAVRVRTFARNYRNAEVDMHFSLAEDLTTLREFLALLRSTGLHGTAVMLERGTI